MNFILLYTSSLLSLDQQYTHLNAQHHLCLLQPFHFSPPLPSESGRASNCLETLTISGRSSIVKAEQDQTLTCIHSKELSNMCDIDWYRDCCTSL